MAAVDYLSNNRVFRWRMAFSRRGFNRFTKSINGAKSSTYSMITKQRCDRLAGNFFTMTFASFRASVKLFGVCSHSAALFSLIFSRSIKKHGGRTIYSSSCPRNKVRARLAFPSQMQKSTADPCLWRRRVKSIRPRHAPSRSAVTPCWFNLFPRPIPLGNIVLVLLCF